MRTDILMVTFRRDLEFASYAMRSVRKFATGFGENIVVVPEPDGDAFRAMAEPLGFTVKTFDEWPDKGMLHHMALICEADKWCPCADTILHMDADCLFTGPVDASDYFIEGKPVLYREKFANIVGQTNRYTWKAAVKSAIGIDPEWETMVLHPAVHWRETYELTRGAIEKHTGLGFKEYIRSCKNIYPQNFCEFCTLGTIAGFAPERYHFIEQAHGNTECLADKSRGKMKAFWSHGGITMDNDRHPGRTAQQVMEEILA